MPTTQQKMKLSKIFQKAIDEQDARMAVNWVLYLNSLRGLSAEGEKKYLDLHGVDYREFNQLWAESWRLRAKPD